MRISKKYAVYFCWAGPFGVAHEIQIYKLHIRWVRLSGGDWYDFWHPWRRLSIDWLKAPDDARDPFVIFRVNKPFIFGEKKSFWCKLKEAFWS